MSRYKENYTLFKRGNYWYYRTYINGIRTTAHTTGKTSKNAAKDYCEALLSDGSLKSSGRNITFRVYASNFLDDSSPFVMDRKKPLSINTLYMYRSYLKFLLDDIGSVVLTDITYSFLKELRQRYTEEGSANTAASRLQMLKLVIETAYRDDVITKNPFEKFSISVDIKVKEAFTLEEVKQIYNSVMLKDKVLLMALTGLRIQECLGLTPEDVKKTDKGIYFIDLKKQLSRDRKYIPLKVDSVRQIPIIPELVPLCYEHIVTYQKARSEIPIYMEGKSIHSLRHFFITNSKASNINPVKVEYIAGHKLAGVQGIYTNFTADDVVDILEWQKKVYVMITEHR